MRAVLFIFSGLPAVGKSTIAKYVAKKHKAIYLRIDTIEQGLRDLCNVKVQGEGYRLAYRLAAENLNLGINVVADSCNPIDLTRNEWEEIALRNDGRFINIEIVCSDKEEHKSRVETRSCEIENLKLPVWKDVENRAYHPWKKERIVIDTANRSIEVCVKELFNKIEWCLNPRC
jgi:predicted kinase